MIRADTSGTMLRKLVQSMRPRKALSVSVIASTSRPAHASDIDLQELLGRKPVNLDTPELQRFLARKRILVTGAGGSIGSEICRQAMKFLPEKLILIERSEGALFEIDRELREKWAGSQVLPLLADICDRERIDRIFMAHQPDVVFHAAAHKHVPLMEHNPGEAVRNNVFGTKVVADAAQKTGCGAFVLISTDKAVNPTSVMGATKRVAEIYVQSLNVRSQESGEANLRPEPLRADGATASTAATRFVAVRFGNVLGSSGSVVPIFTKQIDAGGPVTVTHPEMCRYFMTIPEASQLVMQAGAIGKGGEIFVLDMGRPVRIVDLATALIRQRGLVPGEDIHVRFTGVRPGEKLYEELACTQERVRETSHPKISVWELAEYAREDVRQMLEMLRATVEGSREQILRALRNCVPEYSPDLNVLEPSDLLDQAARLRVLAREAARHAA